MVSKTKLKKTYNLLIRIVIISVAYIFIYFQIFRDKDLLSVSGYFNALFHSSKFMVFVIVVFILMIFNWGIETLKWRFLIAKIEKISMTKALKAVFAGITVSSITPNQIGDYFGRVFILEKSNPWEGVFITIIGSISQLLVTILFGSFAAFYFFREYFQTEIEFSGFIMTGILILIVILNAFLLSLYFNVSIISKFFTRFIKDNWIRVKSYMSIFSRYSTKDLGIVIFLSAFRYFVFSLQFYLLLKAFSIHIPLFTGMMLIFVHFFINTAIPGFALADVGVRGTVALFVFSTYLDIVTPFDENYKIAIVATSTFLWIINIMIPTLVGTFFIPKLKFFRNQISNDN